MADFTPDALEAAGALKPAPDPGYTYPTDPAVAQTLQRWQDMKFGVIIHWGIYSFIGQAGSWSLHREDLGDFTDKAAGFEGTDGQYQTWYYDQARNFKGQEFDANQWAQAAADAGAKYLIFTTKHHDGFAMYDSAFSNLKCTAEDAGLGRDIFAEVVQAAREVGLETGVYFSKADWSRPDYWDRANPISDRFHNYDISVAPRRWDRFVQFSHDQIRELLSKYGKQMMLWLDAGWVRGPEEPFKIEELAAMARELQPGILMVDREVHGPHENYRTPEQEIPDQGPAWPWESCVTLTKSWCSMSRDDETKPTAQVIEDLLKVISRGGNYLLGIGPDATGHMSVHIRESLSQIGKWVGAHAVGIYGTRRADDIKVRADNARVYCMRKENRLFVFVVPQERPGRKEIKLWVPGRYTSAQMLDGGPIQFEVGDGGAEIEVNTDHICGLQLS